MRMGALVLLIWLVIGAFAARQRHYYSGAPGCLSFAARGRP